VRILPRAGSRVQFSVRGFEHIVPASRGGSKSESNAALSCRACNLHKAAHLTGADSESTDEVRLFNPREDSWAEHFQLDPKFGAILGVTSIGRGTVARLQMNSEAQIAARLHWMRLEIFP
jgi:HNH endonuclease